MKQFKIDDVKELNTKIIEVEIGKHANELEKRGMSHDEACIFISNIINLGIVFQERWNEEHPKYAKELITCSENIGISKSEIIRNSIRMCCNLAYHNAKKD